MDVRVDDGLAEHGLVLPPRACAAPTSHKPGYVPVRPGVPGGCAAGGVSATRPGAWSPPINSTVNRHSVVTVTDAFIARLRASSPTLPRPSIRRVRTGRRRCPPGGGR